MKEEEEEEQSRRNPDKNHENYHENYHENKRQRKEASRSCSACFPRSRRSVAPVGVESLRSFVVLLLGFPDP